MAKFCSNCGNEVKETDNVCSNCGNRLKEGQAGGSNFEDQVKSVINDVKNDSKDYTQDEINNGKLMAILAYLGLLFLIPLLAEKENKFVKYHLLQGINMFIWAMIFVIACAFVPFVGYVLSPLFGLCWFALMIMGIVNVCNGEAKEIPVINKLPVIVKNI